jgi:outer membrane lipoprotein-sorting protein
MSRARAMGRTAAAVIAAAFALGAGAGPARSKDAPVDGAGEWLTHAASCFRGIDTASAAISFEVTRGRGERELARRGTVSVKRGGFLRAEIGEPAALLVVADGRTVRTWSPADGIVVEEPYDGSALSAAFALLFGEAPSKRAVSLRLLGGAAGPSAGGPAALEIAFTPGAALGARAVVGLTPACPAIASVVVEGSAGDAIRFAISDVRLGARAPDRSFAFTPPRGATIVRP